MNTKAIHQAQDPDLANALAALERAAQRARELALQTGTMLAVWKDGQCVLTPPEERPVSSAPSLAKIEPETLSPSEDLAELVGSLSLREDPLAYQRRMRDEWS
jgi:hypothetical protein